MMNERDPSTRTNSRFVSADEQVLHSDHHEHAFDQKRQSL